MSETLHAWDDRRSKREEFVDFYGASFVYANQPNSSIAK